MPHALSVFISSIAPTLLLFQKFLILASIVTSTYLSAT
jgi:hypothetical protein